MGVNKYFLDKCPGQSGINTSVNVCDNSCPGGFCPAIHSIKISGKYGDGICNSSCSGVTSDKSSVKLIDKII